MENKVDPQLLMNDQMKAVLQKSAELAGDAFVTDVGFAEMRENYASAASGTRAVRLWPRPSSARSKVPWANSWLATITPSKLRSFP